MKLWITSLSLAVALNFTACATREDADKGIPMKLMTYNIRIGKGGGEWNNDSSKVNLEPVAALIENEKPDLVGLQEVDRFRARTSWMNQPKQLANRLGMNITFQPAYVVNIPGSKPEEYGNALLSSYQIKNSDRFALFKPDYSKTNPNYPDYYSEQRGLLHAKVLVHGTIVHIFATHLGLTPDQREKQIDQIIKAMAEVEGPKILFGDFNAEPTEPAMKTLSSHYKDVLSAAGVSDENRKSFPAGLQPTGAIDYIFVSSEFQVVNARVIRDVSLASDHNPVIAEVRLKSPK